MRGCGVAQANAATCAWIDKHAERLRALLDRLRTEVAKYEVRNSRRDGATRVAKKVSETVPVRAARAQKGCACASRAVCGTLAFANAYSILYLYFVRTIISCS